MPLILCIFLLMTSGCVQASSGGSSSASFASAHVGPSSDDDMCKGCLPQARCAFFKEKAFEKSQILQDNQVYAENISDAGIDCSGFRVKHYYNRNWFYRTLDGVLVHGALPKHEQEESSNMPLQHEVFPDNDKEAWRFLAYKYYHDINPYYARRILNPSPQTEQLLKKITSDCTDNSTIVWLRERLESRKEGRVFHALFKAMRQQRKEEYLAPKIAQAQNEYYEQKKAGGESLISWATEQTIDRSVSQQLAARYYHLNGQWPRHHIGSSIETCQEIERHEKIIIEKKVRKTTPIPPALLPIRLPTNPNKIAFDPANLPPTWGIKMHDGKIQRIVQRTNSLVSTNIEHALRTAQVKNCFNCAGD